MALFTSQSSVCRAVREEVATLDIPTSGSTSVTTRRMPSAARPGPGTKALTAGAGGSRRRAVPGCRRVPPVLIDIEGRPRQVPPVGVNNCFRESSIKPPTPTPAGRTGPDTAADALVELLSPLTRRQHEHRARTVERLTAVLDTCLLPAGLEEMALYYQAKAYRDTGHGPESRRSYQQVADGNGRLAPAARRGLAQAARLAGDFPTAHAAAQTLGWEGRHHRVLGDLWWLQGEPDAPRPPTWPGAPKPNSTASPGKQPTTRPCAPSPSPSTTPARPTTRSTSPTSSSPASTCAPPRSTRPSPPRSATPAIPHSTSVSRPAHRAGHRGPHLHGPHPRTLRRVPPGRPRRPRRPCRHRLPAARTGPKRGYAYYVGIATFMAGLPLPAGHTPPHWLDGEQTTRSRWRTLVTPPAPPPQPPVSRLTCIYD